MQALISPNENVYSLGGELLGARVVEVSENAFPIASPLFWMPCASDTVAMDVYYNRETKTIDPIPVDPEALIQQAEAAALAEASNIVEV